VAEAEFHQILQAGVDLWNRHRFFACHDKLEEAWKQVKHEKKKEKASDPRRDFVHGIILLAVAYHHWRNRNRIGALRKLDEGMRLLSPYPDSFAGMDLRSLQDAVAADFARLQEAADAPYRGRNVPRIRLA
jgi:predicted metal-dependent hydrolase